MTIDFRTIINMDTPTHPFAEHTMACTARLGTTRAVLAATRLRQPSLPSVP